MILEKNGAVGIFYNNLFCIKKFLSAFFDKQFCLKIDIFDDSLKQKRCSATYIFRYNIVDNLSRFPMNFCLVDIYITLSLRLPLRPIIEVKIDGPSADHLVPWGPNYFGPLGVKWV